MVAAGMALLATGAVAQDNDPSVPGICYRVLDSYADCLQAAFEAAKDSDPKNVPIMKVQIDNVKHLRNLLPTNVKAKGAQQIAVICRDTVRAQFMNVEMTVIMDLNNMGASKQALHCRADMDSIR